MSYEERLKSLKMPTLAYSWNFAKARPVPTRTTANVKRETLRRYLLLQTKLHHKVTPLVATTRLRGRKRVRRQRNKTSTSPPTSRLHSHGKEVFRMHPKRPGLLSTRTPTRLCRPQNAFKDNLVKTILWDAGLDISSHRSRWQGKCHALTLK